MNQVQVFGAEIEHVASVEFKPLGTVEIPLLRQAPSSVHAKDSRTPETEIGAE